MALKQQIDSNADTKMKRKDYEKDLRKLQVELCHLQEWIKATGARIIVIFEGRDAADKGGTIKAITERVSPRVFRAVALPAPSNREKTQMFMQRYVQQFPAAGEIVIFDRSWYNRAGVEHVIRFCTAEEHQRFLKRCPQIEKYIVDGGIQLIKIWLEVGTDEQERRFTARIDDPLRQWKLSPMDLISPLVRLLEGPGFDARGDRQQTRTVVHHPFGRQAARATQLHFPHFEIDSIQAGSATEGQATQTIGQGQIRRSSVADRQKVYLRKVLRRATCRENCKATQLLRDAAYES
jgi:polyphosphate kinase 2